jgi:hypothetical protein
LYNYFGFLFGYAFKQELNFQASILSSFAILSSDSLVNFPSASAVAKALSKKL